MKATDDLVDDAKFSLQNFTKIDAIFLNKNSEFLRQYSKTKRQKKIRDPGLLQKVIKESYSLQNYK